MGGNLFSTILLDNIKSNIQKFVAKYY